MIYVIEVPNVGKNKIESFTADTYYRPVVDGLKLSAVAETHDVALILALERKYGGLNSQFTKFACRMLQIDSVWAE